jgi:hypothetical protein
MKKVNQQILEGSKQMQGMGGDHLDGSFLLQLQNG